MPEQLKIQQKARELVAEHVIPLAAEWDKKGSSVGIIRGGRSEWCIAADKCRRKECQ
jgi:hypothetical protein